MNQRNQAAIPATPAASDIRADLLRRLDFLRDRLTPPQRMNMIAKLLVQFRDTIYPWMHILRRADGSLVVTINQPPADAR
ncbi:hypothetical protein B7C42_01624 [Nocardia cerradoensis]|uniref:Uncharacterized protein n=1 Tax=Nocardia cerradoensis TaxID=85688 RepID=A0A231HCM9_9NOCA|nr:hypothetical protein [Nocardia cerradoensis]OXR46650.1 hypothetical protein B7C42_01624 [Nocardia cerradoensis]